MAEAYKVHYASDIKSLPDEAAFIIFENYAYDDSRYLLIRWVESQAALRDFLVKNMGDVHKFKIMNVRPVKFDFDVSVRFD